MIEDVEPPEEQEARATRSAAWPPTPAPRSVGQPGMSAAKKRVQRLAADPALDAEPAARDERAHERRQVRADGAVGGAREDREGDAVLRAGVRVERGSARARSMLPSEDRDERLPPVHARGRSAPTRACTSGCSAPSRSRARRSCRSSSCGARSAPARGPRCRAGSSRSARRRGARRGRPDASLVGDGVGHLP